MAAFLLHHKGIYLKGRTFHGNHTHHAAAHRKGRTEGQAISDIIDYVANPQKTDHGKLITGYECDSRVADAEFLLAKRQYISATGRVRGTDDVIAYHVRQSFCPGEVTPEEANRLGVNKTILQPILPYTSATVCRCLHFGGRLSGEDGAEVGERQ